MEETLPDKGILEKLIREGKSLIFYIATNKLNPKQARTLKHLIVYNNLRTYINPKRHDRHAHNWLSCMRPCIQA
jgi:hypothetical protein